MPEDHEATERALEPPTEEVHLPEPSYIPVALAFGITLIVVGVVIAPLVISTLGVIISVICIVRWIRQTREEMAELPLEH